MNEDSRQTLRLLSLLLHYPGENTVSPGRLSLLPGPEKEVLGAFCDYLRGRALLHLQGEYTRTFDLNPGTSLNLTNHHPEAKSRGKLLLWLREEYEDAGYEPVPGELPDYLPLILEFLAVCPDDSRRRICTQYAGAVSTLASRLKDAGSPYAGLMGLVKKTFSVHSSAGKKVENCSDLRNPLHPPVGAGLKTRP